MYSLFYFYFAYGPPHVFWNHNYIPFGASYSMRYVGIRSAQSVAICDKGYFLLLREKDIDTRVHGICKPEGNV